MDGGGATDFDLSGNDGNCAILLLLFSQQKKKNNKIILLMNFSLIF